MKLLLGLDIGTSAIKGALFSPQGEEIALAVKEYDIDKFPDGRVELDAECYCSGVKSVIAELLIKCDMPVECIAAVGVTSQGESLICLDENGKPLRKAILWLDNRAVKQAEDLTEHFGSDFIYEHTGQQEVPAGYTAAIMKYLSEKEPDVFCKTHKFMLVADYVIYRLTGQMVMDAAIAPSTLLMDIDQHCWSDKILDYIGVDASQLPQLVKTGSVAGKICSTEFMLKTGTPVCSAPIDQITGAVGAGNISSGMVSESTGTSLVVCATASDKVLDPKQRMGLFIHGIDDKFILMPWAPVGGMLLRCFRDEFTDGMSFIDLDKQASEIGAGAEGLMILPHWAGSVCPVANPQAKGIVHGLSLGHKKAHFARAAMESIAYLLRDNLDALEDIGIDTSTVLSLGGGARSKLWLQIKADVLNRRVITLECDETTCLGAAVIAAVGTGIYKSIADAVKNMVKQKAVYTPDLINNKIYEQQFKRYQELNKVYM